MDDKANKVVDEILKRGNDVKIKNKGNGYIVIEEKKEIKYRSSG